MLCIGVLLLWVIGVLEALPDMSPHAHFDVVTNKTSLVFGANGQDQGKFSPSMIWESFRNKKIAFLGDSVTRYQYHDLAYFLTKKHWPKPFDVLCNEKRFNNWKKFFEYAHEQIGEHMLSETFRQQDTCCGGWSVCDNRQLHIPELNATVWYFLWYGQQSRPHGHFNIEKGLVRPPCRPGECNESASNSTWMLQPAEFMQRFIAAHNPDLFFVNCGLHGYPLDEAYPYGVDQGKQFKAALDTLRTMKNITTRVIWKATTPHHFHYETIRESVAEGLAKSSHWEMFNQNSIIIELSEAHRGTNRTHEHNMKFTWDGAHYNCWVYSEMNRELAVRFLYDKV